MNQQPHHQREGSQFRRRGDQQCHAHRGTAIHVGHPHVERHGAELEGHRHHDEGHGDHETGAMGRIDRGDLVEAQGAGQAVEHRHAVEQHAGSNGAEHEVLDRRLCGHAGITIEGHQRVQRQRQQLDAEINGEQASRRRQHADAEQRCERQHLVLTAADLAALEVGLGIEQRQADAEECRELEEGTKAIGDVQAVEQHGALRHRANGDGEPRAHGQCHQRQHRRHASPHGRGHEHVRQQDHADGHGQRYFGAGRAE